MVAWPGEIIAPATLTVTAWHLTPVDGLTWVSNGSDVLFVQRPGSHFELTLASLTTASTVLGGIGPHYWSELRGCLVGFSAEAGETTLVALP